MNKNIKKLIITIICVIVLVFLLFNTSLGRYIYNAINNYILSSKEFYFESSVLDVDTPVYSIVNWDGVNPYTLNIDVNGKKNELVSTSVDIEYEVDIECPSSVICSLSKENGIIYAENKTDSYTITVTPVDNFYEGDTVTITTSATSTSPYTKEISAKYIIGVENYGFSYNIEDSIGSKIMTLNLTNSRPYYVVKEAFDDYVVGDQVSLGDYSLMSDENKRKCISTQVTITFDPNNILLDLTSEAYINCVASTTTTIGDYLYVNSITLNVDASSNKEVIFYKNDINSDYTDSDIVSIDVQK